MRILKILIKIFILAWLIPIGLSHLFLVGTSDLNHELITKVIMAISIYSMLELADLIVGCPKCKGSGEVKK